MFQIKLSDKENKEYIATLNSPIVPRSGEIIVFDIAQNQEICKITGVVSDVIYVFALNETYIQIELSNITCFSS